MSDSFLNEQDYSSYKYRFLPYQPVYAQWAEQEIQRLKKSIVANFQIEHIGSTAVPGLGGKKVIDLMIVIPTQMAELESEPAELIATLINLGYRYRPKVRLSKERWFLDWFEQVGDEITRGFHLHLITQAHNQVPIEIRFRDYLRSHPQDCALYARSKQKAVIAASQQITKEEKKQAYMAAKDPIIKEILAKIEQEQSC